MYHQTDELEVSLNLQKLFSPKDIKFGLVSFKVFVFAQIEVVISVCVCPTEKQGDIVIESALSLNLLLIEYRPFDSFTSVVTAPKIVPLFPYPEESQTWAVSIPISANVGDQAVAVSPFSSLIFFQYIVDNPVENADK